MNSDRFDGISREQARAFRHATGEEGLAIIDGLPGTGKSRTTSAVREAYEQAGCRVIGLAWTHKVVQGMEASGFQHTDTVKRELFMLANGREQWNEKTVVVIDEAAMLDTAHMAMVTAYAQEAGAKLILVGDDRQLPSIERGGMFGVLKDRHGAATLTEIRRQYEGDDRRSSEYFAEGKFHDALGIYQAKGAVHWTRTQGEARAELLDTYGRDVAASPEKSRFIFAYTNLDVAELNRGAREIHRQLGRLGQDHELECADGKLAFAAGDRIQFAKTDKKAGLYNGAAGTIKHIENGRVFAEIDGSGKTVAFDSAQYQSFRHGYAGTIYKGQGATVDQSYLYHSEHWRSAASYVGMTRHREKAELFAAKNTAADLDQLARQMARVDDGKRYAASYYHSRQHIGPVPPLTAAEILAGFGDKRFEREQQEERREARRSAGGGDIGYSHGGYTSQTGAALREHTSRQRQPEQQQPANQNSRDAADKAEPVTIEAIQRDPWNAVALDLPANADHELLFRVANASRELHSTLTERSGQADTPEQQELWLKLAEQATARQQEAESAILARDAAIRPEAETAEELILDDIAERVQRIIDDPTRAAEESDPRILQALQDRRDAEQTERPAEREAEKARRLAEEPTASEERQPESSAVKEAKEMDSAATSEEMTDSKQVQYSRWTGERLGPTTGPTQEQGRGQSQSGGGRSRTR